MSSTENEYEIISNAMEIKARGGYIIEVNHKNNPVFDFFITIPELNLSPDNPNTDPCLPVHCTQRSRPRQRYHINNLNAI